MTVLIADDHEPTRRLLATRLHNWGHETVTVGNGLAAWNELQSKPISLVISDWSMPELSGVELCNKVRSTDLGRYVYLILCTGRGEKADLIEGLDAGADDFLKKPVDFEELRVALRGATRVLELETRLRRHNDELQNMNAQLEQAYATIDSDMRAAAALQRELLPKQGIHLDGIDTAWFFIPARYLAGDIFNFYSAGPGRIAFFHLDVSGHGTASALLSVSLSRVLYGQSGSSKDEEPVSNPAVVVERLNARFQNLADMYFTMVYGVFDVRDQKICFAQAGHPHPILAKADGSVRQTGEGGFPVGLMHPMDYHSTSLPFLPGDRFYLYSDGIVECRNVNGEPFGEDRLMNALREAAPLRLDQAVAYVESVIRDWCSQTGFDDDLSLLAFASDPPKA